MHLYEIVKNSFGYMLYVPKSENLLHLGTSQLSILCSLYLYRLILSREEYSVCISLTLHTNSINFCLIVIGWFRYMMFWIDGFIWVHVWCTYSFILHLGYYSVPNQHTSLCKYPLQRILVICHGTFHIIPHQKYESSICLLVS